jgi:hypothetical protein
MALEEIARWLPSLANKPRVVEQCYDLFAPRFVETLIPSAASIDGVLHEVALQDRRAAGMTAPSLIAPPR